MKFRIAKQNDLPALAKIRGTDPASEEYWFERITAYYKGTQNPQEALPSRVIFVAQEDDKIVAFIAGHLTRRFDCEGELQWIDTVAGYRSNGIASKLFGLLADWFSEHNAKRICVNCAPDNAVAQNFYRKNGATPLNDHWLIWNDIKAVHPPLS